MEKKRTKPLKSLRLRKESLKTLTTEQLVKVNAAGDADPWDCCAFGGTALNSASVAAV